MSRARMCAFVVLFALAVSATAEDAAEGYYRTPAIRGSSIAFSAEGDLWIIENGADVARRLTTHHGDETDPAISPDGAAIAFSAQYEGPVEVYTIPIAGGVPVRHTWEGRTRVIGWS